MQSPIDMQQDIMQYSDSALICCQLLEIILALGSAKNGYGSIRNIQSQFSH